MACQASDLPRSLLKLADPVRVVILVETGLEALCAGRRAGAEDWAVASSPGRACRRP
jgi:hypothetical protein